MGSDMCIRDRSLCYAQSCAAYFHPYESNRIRRIQNVLKPTSLFKIDRSHSVADYGTMMHLKMTRDDLMKEQISFVTKHKSLWPVSTVSPNSDKLPGILSVYKDVSILRNNSSDKPFGDDVVSRTAFINVMRTESNFNNLVKASAFHYGFLNDVIFSGADFNESDFDPPRELDIDSDMEYHTKTHRLITKDVFVQRFDEFSFQSKSNFNNLLGKPKRNVNKYWQKKRTENNRPVEFPFHLELPKLKKLVKSVETEYFSRLFQKY